MTGLTASWQFWAFASAVFAAFTAILAKVGVNGVNSDFATLVRTLVILPVVALFTIATGRWQAPDTVPGRSYLFLVLSGLATGASWLCYFRALQLGDASKVAPVDKASVLLVALFAMIFLGERLSAANWAGVAFVAVGIVLLAAR